MRAEPTKQSSLGEGHFRVGAYTVSNKREKELFHFRNVGWASGNWSQSQKAKQSSVINTGLVLSLPGKQGSIALTELFITLLTGDDG